MDAIIRAYEEHGDFCGITEVQVEDRGALAEEMKKFAKRKKMYTTLVGTADLFTVRYDKPSKSFTFVN